MDTVKIVVKEYKPRAKDQTKTNHWTLHARRYTSVQAEYYRRNAEAIREKNRLRYLNNPEVREKSKQRATNVRVEKQKLLAEQKQKLLEEKNQKLLDDEEVPHNWRNM